VADTFAADTFAADTFAADTFAADTFAADTFAAEPFAAEPFVEETFEGETFAAGLVATMTVLGELLAPRRRLVGRLVGDGFVSEKGSDVDSNSGWSSAGR
jgi:hypothetical protein